MGILREVVREVVHEREVQELRAGAVGVEVLVEEVRDGELADCHDQAIRWNALLDEVARSS